MNPYLIQGPALISFSGGRTSAYMLHEIVRAHGGKLPDDINVVFANTGKEREETLRFVHEVGTRWDISIRWVEWRDAEPCFEEVGYNSASREGEPFHALIAKKKMLPNGVARFCTSFLKIVAMHAFMASLGYAPGTYREAVGLRHDEGRRLLNMYANNERDHRQCVAPLSKAKIVKADVMAFWQEQPFDLGLKPWEGNCDFCFNKGRLIRERIARDNPDVPLWWIGEEAAIGSTFSKRESVSDIIAHVARSPMLFDVLDEEYDVECGLHCAAEDAA